MTRPRYQTGSLLIRGTHKKMYVARYYEDAIGSDGALQRVRCSVVLGPVSEIGSRRAAQAKLTELLRPINRGWQKPRVMLTFGEFVQEQWQPKVLCLFKLSTQVGYRPLLARHLLPYFGHQPLSKITPAQAQGFLSEKAKTGISWHAVRNLRNLLSRILRTAVEWGYLEENPVFRVKLPPKPIPPPANFLRLEQVRQLLAALREPYRSMVLLAVLTGLRRSELFALSWGAVDLERALVWIRQGVYRGQFSTPKTHASKRCHPVAVPTVELLRSLRVRARQAGPNDLVFCSRRGTPVNPDNALKRVIHPACDRLGLPRVGWHTLRHTHATQLDQQGESPKTVQALLGHADVETTLAVYTHAVPDSLRHAEERLAREVLDPNGPKLDPGRKTETEEGAWIQ